jgi:hypothetical protein
MTAGVAGTVIATGKSGNTYSRQCWFTEGTGLSMRWDQGAGVSATLGETFTTFPEDIWITDIIIGTATTPASNTFRLTLNGAPSSQSFILASQLTSVAFRPPIRLFVPYGSRLGGIMLTV